ncbi:unnamed protein product [Mytilus edulis]|uniref:Uncharacterized protein n=1 Tax=Mytilus edulis TaxID=6550 RepID=A0A8S3RAA2_MYTED|nr:unnamed protein product [Mytilus edulis]
MPLHVNKTKPIRVVVCCMRIGGTTDITVHKRQFDGSLEEVLPPSGGDWGGTAVDRAYLEFVNSESVSCAGQKLSVKPEAFRKLFKSTIDSIIKHVDKLLKHPNLSDLHHIIMVGGFSECELVQTAMRQKFPNKKIIIPDEAGLAVLRGAVLFGHQPKIIGKRILRKTYGIQSWPEWDAELHPKPKECELMELIVAKMFL